MKLFLISIFLFCGQTSIAQSWQQVLSVPNGDDVEAILADGSGHVFISTDTAPFSTTNEGMTWQYDTSGLEAPDEFSFAETEDGTLFAGTELAGVFRSSDHGLHWQDVNNGIPDTANIPALICDREQELFAASTTGIYYSSDKGDHWTPGRGDMPSIPIATLAYSSADDIYAGLTGHIAHSTDRGVHWNFCDTLQPLDEVLALGADSNGTVFAGTFYSLLLRSSNGGSTWDTVSPPQPKPIRCITISGRSVFVGTYGAGVWRSDDLGDHWKAISDGLSRKDLNVLCSAVTHDSNLFIGTLTASVFKAPVSASARVADPEIQQAGLQLHWEFGKPVLHFSLPAAENIELSVCDVCGREIQELISGIYMAGDHSIDLQTLPKFKTCILILTTPSGRNTQPVIAP